MEKGRRQCKLLISSNCMSSAIEDARVGSYLHKQYKRVAAKEAFNIEELVPLVKSRDGEAVVIEVD